MRLGGALGTMRVGDMSVGMPGAHEGLIGTIAKGLIACYIPSHELRPLIHPN